MENLESCPICQKSSFTKYLEGVDYFLTREPFLIQQCLNCEFRFTNPRPDSESMQKYYDSKNYISHEPDLIGFIPFLYKVARQFMVREKYGIINRYSSGKSILDIGCGTGEFLNFCREKGWKCFGIEPSEKARGYAFRKYNLAMDSEFLYSEKIPGNHDCITLWHVLEHIHDLNPTFEKIKKLLSKDGILVLALPNSNSYDAGIYQQFWAAYDLPRHLYHFTETTIKLLATNYNLTCIKTIPLKIDAFYISILSEKYKNSSFGLLKGLKAGIKSNRKAKQSGYGYSSMIYILKNKIF